MNEAVMMNVRESRTRVLNDADGFVHRQAFFDAQTVAQRAPADVFEQKVRDDVSCLVGDEADDAGMLKAFEGGGFEAKQSSPLARTLRGVSIMFTERVEAQNFTDKRRAKGRVPHRENVRVHAARNRVRDNHFIEF